MSNPRCQSKHVCLPKPHFLFENIPLDHPFNYHVTFNDLKQSSSNAGAGFDFTGAAAYDNSKVHTTDDDEDGSAIDYDGHEGERIIAVAGVIQAGKGNNLGLSYVHTDIETVRKAKVNDSTITTQSVNVDARNESLMYNVAAGLGVSTGKLSGMGSVSVQELNNNVIAEISIHLKALTFI